MKKIIFIAIVIFGYTSIFCQTKISVDSVSKYVGEHWPLPKFFKSTILIKTKVFCPPLRSDLFFSPHSPISSKTLEIVLILRVSSHFSKVEES